MELRFHTREWSAGEARAAATGPLLALADRLFGKDVPEREPTPRWLLRYLGVVAVLAAIIVARRPDAVTNPQFWAEDASIYFYENLTLGFGRAFLKLYNGYPNLAQRLVAMVGGWVPFADAPTVYTTGAIAVTALALASFALPGFRHLVRSDALRVLFCVAAVSLPFDQEVLSTPTNLGWFLAVWLSLLSVMRLPRQPWRVALLALGGGVAIFSTPLAPLNAPLWLLRAWRGVRRRDPYEVGFVLALVTGLAAVVGLAGDLGRDARLSLLDKPRAAAQRYAQLVYHRVALLVLPKADAERLLFAHESATAEITAVVLAWLLGASALARFRNLTPLLVALYLALGALALSALGRPALLYLEPYEVPFRYAIFPGTMLVLAVVVALDGLPTGPRSLLAAGAVALLAFAWSPAFVVKPFRDYDWPRGAAHLEQKLWSKSRAPLSITVNPPWAPLVFDFIDMAQEVRVAPGSILGGLGTNGHFRQSFVSRCDRLTAVEMQLAAKAPSSRGALRMTLLELSANKVVAQVEIPREGMWLDGGRQLFPFDPIQGSAGKRYLIVLQAVQNDFAASVWVLGERGDPYPDGEAVYAGQVIDGDVSFRYGCVSKRSG